MDSQVFAKTIKERRLKLGLTQSQLAQKLDVSNKTISKWENAHGYPDITLLAKITTILNLNYEQLLESSDYIIAKQKKKRKIIVVSTIIVLLCSISLYLMIDYSNKSKFNNEQIQTINRLTNDYYLNGSVTYAYRSNEDLIVTASKKININTLTHICDHINITSAKEIESFESDGLIPVINYIEEYNVDEQYEIYLTNENKDQMIISVLNKNIIKIDDQLLHKTIYYQIDDISNEVNNIDDLAALFYEL